MDEISYDRVKLPDFAIKFAATFLRFEFALKEAGFSQRSRADIEWGRVAKKLGSTFYTRIRDSGNAETIMQLPPKKQVAREHRLEWEPQDPPTNVHELFLAIRCVRNNLVHGGKSGDPDHDPNDPQRNENLITEAQWIVEQALHQMEEVRNFFEGRY